MVGSASRLASWFEVRKKSMSIYGRELLVITRGFESVVFGTLVCTPKRRKRKKCDELPTVAQGKWPVVINRAS